MDFEFLRPYQQQAINEVRMHIKNGVKTILVVSPTGSGKTALSAFMADSSQQKGKRSVFVVDRITLVDQTSAAFDSYGIDHGVIQGGHYRFRPDRKVQIASAQTISRRKWPQADLMFVDETHNLQQVVKDKLSKRDIVAIGLTATPFTKGLADYYDAVVNVTTTNKLIEEGYLSPYRIFAPSEPDMKGVKVKAGEWDETEASQRAMQIVGDAVKEYTTRCMGKKFICSAVDTTHVDALVRQFNEAGVFTVGYTYQTSDDECREIVREFKKHDSAIRGLVTVTKASKGFDVPDIEVVIMCRPLRNSLAEFIQLFGRGLRTSKDTGKTECIVLDHSGNTVRFWDDWTYFFEHGTLSLQSDDKKPKEKKANDDDSEPKQRVCPKCTMVHGWAPFCPGCGHEYPKRAAVEHVSGNLTEIVKSGTSKTQTEVVWPQVVAYARQSKGSTPEAEKYALALFKSLTGGWPNSTFNAAPEVAVSSKLVGLIKQKEFAYRAMQKKLGRRA